MKHKKLKISLISAAVAIFMLVASLTVYAYFTTRVYVYTADGQEVAHMGMNLQLLFGKLDPDKVADGKPLRIPNYTVHDTGYLVFNDGATETLFDHTAPWGSAKNPYIISEARHLQNLSALQNAGYFDLLYIGDNYDTDGNYINGSASIPYFLICDTDGTPINIDGTQIKVPVKPIGSAEHPFIGVIGGAFVDDYDENGNLDQDEAPAVAGKLTAVSAIHNFKVQTSTDQVDVGLFGYIGYMGQEPTTNITADSTFTGVVSVIQDILISDVQVTVNQPDVAEEVSKLLGHVFNTHRFTFGQAMSHEAQTPPHEDHHIGIFAGHVSYAHLKNISVYYSSDDVCAMDLLHTNTNTNYHSSTGILGFMHNMNSTVKNPTGDDNQPNNHCQISYGGVSSTGINLIPDGNGTGGGKKFGSGRGYVVAKNLFEGTHYIQTNQAMGDRVWQYRTSEGGAWTYAMMFFQNPGANTYKDIYGNTATVDTENKTVTANGIVYTQYILRNIISGNTADTYKYRDVLHDDTVLWDQVVEEAKEPDDQKEESEFCREVSQTIWQFVAEKPEEGVTPTWVDAVVVYETGVGTGQYTLEDKTTSVTLGAANGDGTYSATMTNVKITTAEDRRPAITKVICLRKQSDGSYKCSLTATGDMQEAYLYRSKALLIKDAKNMFGDDLCILSEGGFALTGGQDHYYFYDGVFTFALSSDEDTIEATWENNTPDKIVLGSNDLESIDENWVANTTYGNKATVAYVKQIRDLAALNERIALNNDDNPDNDRDIFVLYKTGGDNIFLMTLYDKSTENSLSWDSWAQKYTTNGKGLSFANQTLTDSIVETLRGDNEFNLDADIIQQIDEGVMQVVNLGSAEDITTLQSQYLIDIGLNSDGTYSIFSAKGQNRMLSMIQTTRLGGWLGTYYNIYCGTGPGNVRGTEIYTASSNNTTSAHLTDGIADGGFRISFEYTDSDNNENIRYVSYATVNDKAVFASSSNANDSTILYFYTVEPTMHDMDFGHITFEPAEGATNLSFDADKYILWPKAVMNQQGTLVTPMGSFTPGTVQTGAGYHDAGDSVTNGNATTADIFKTYKLVGLADLIAGDAGWQDGRGNLLSMESLHQKFTMQQSIKFGVSLKVPLDFLPNFQLNDTSVLAPVGPDGTMANVPTGSIAFRIAKAQESTVRVIVSVPLSKYYDGYQLEGSNEIVGLATDVDYYLGLWQTENLEDGQWNFTQFDQSSAEVKFELPRSRPYEPGKTADEAEYILVEHNNQTYRCYLNGDRILVGYEFKVMGPGTYILGTAVGESGLLTDSDHGYPMEIIYCAADGTASKGRDGTSGSVIGAIDYVYDYQGQIVHVQDYTDTVPANQYQYYYNSRIVTYTDNKADGNPRINDLKIYPRRYIEGSRSALQIWVDTHAADGNTGLFRGKRLGSETDDLFIQPLSEKPTS